MPRRSRQKPTNKKLRQMSRKTRLRNLQQIVRSHSKRPFPH